MTGTRPFVTGDRVRSAIWAEAWAALATLDARHVAGVHGRHGVAEGLEVTLAGRSLVVGPGAAYSPCGQLVVSTRPVTLGPPAWPVDHAVWLDTAGRISVAPLAVGRPTSAIHLGTVSTDGAGGWTADQAPARPELPRPVAPQVGSGRLTLDLRHVEVDREGQMLRVTVDTGNGDFETTPLYMATIAVRDRLEEGHVTRLEGWYTTICAPTPRQFVLRAHLLAQDSIWDDLEGYQALSFLLGTAIIAFDVSWIGVDPRRPGTDPVDPPQCLPPSLARPRPPTVPTAARPDPVTPE